MSAISGSVSPVECGSTCMCLAVLILAFLPRRGVNAREPSSANHIVGMINSLF
jgi:hypothetical protein